MSLQIYVMYPILRCDTPNKLIRPKKENCCVALSGIPEKLGRSVGKSLSFLNIVWRAQKHKFCVHFPHFVSKNTQSEQNWVISWPYFIHFNFWLGSVAEGNTTFFLGFSVSLNLLTLWNHDTVNHTEFFFHTTNHTEVTLKYIYKGNHTDNHNEMVSFVVKGHWNHTET